MNQYPYTNRANQARGFTALSSVSALLAYSPYFQKENKPNAPLRKSLEAPQDRGLFIKPIKQCFVRNSRLMPMTRLMLTLLSGWAGQGGPIETTIGIIAKHVGRSSRMVFNYLQDAAEEGYLYYSRTKDRIGRYTGIKIRLNFFAIRHQGQPKKQSKPAQTLDMKLNAETNSKSIYTKGRDLDLDTKLERLASSFGYEIPEKHPS